MAQIPLTGPITFSQLYGEFNITPTGGVKLSDYYGIFPGVPTTLGTQLRLSDFRGATANPTMTEGLTSYTVTGSKGLAFINIMRGYALNPNEVYGSYTTTTIGSITNGTHNNVTIEAAVYYRIHEEFTNNFAIVLQGNRARSFFTSVTPEGANTLFTSSAYEYGYNSTKNRTLWRWRDNETPLGDNIASQWDGSGTSTVTFS